MDILQAIDINQFPYRYRTILDIPYRYSSPTDIHPIRLYGYPIISHQYIYIYIYISYTLHCLNIIIILIVIIGYLYVKP